MTFRASGTTIGQHVTPAEFARELETDLAATQTALTAAQAACAEKDSALRSAAGLLSATYWPTISIAVHNALSSTCGQPILDALAAAQARVKRLETALENAEAVFRHYADLHEATGNTGKAIANLDEAELCREALKGEVS